MIWFDCISFSKTSIATSGLFSTKSGSCQGNTNTHLFTHTRLTALCPGLPRWAGTRKVKPIWILLKQQTVSGSEIRWAICKPAPCSRQITTPAQHRSVFYRPDALPATQPTASKHWRQTQTHHNIFHTHTLNGPFSGTTRVSQYQKGKANLDFTETRDSEWQWHQLGHMQVCTSLQIDNHASTPTLNFLQAGCPSCCPTNSVKALKANHNIFYISCFTGRIFQWAANQCADIICGPATLQSEIHRLKSRHSIYGHFVGIT